MTRQAFDAAFTESEVEQRSGVLPAWVDLAGEDYATVPDYEVHAGYTAIAGDSHVVAERHGLRRDLAEDFLGEHCCGGVVTAAEAKRQIAA